MPMAGDIRDPHRPFPVRSLLKALIGTQMDIGLLVTGLKNPLSD